MARPETPQLEEIELLIASGSLIEASRFLRSDCVTESDDARELILASRVLALRGRFSDAHDRLDRALQLDHGNVDALIERARLAVRLGDDADADGWFDRAYQQGADGDDWMIDWIDSLLRMGKHDAARDVAMIHCERAPDQAGPWFRLGLAHQQAAHHLHALDAYRHAARIEPTLPMLCNNMGVAHLELKQLDDAKTLLEQALRDDPDNAFAWNNLATTLLRLGDVSDSLVAAERACALAPNYAVALQTYSYVLREHQQWDDALTAAESALKLDPKNMSLVWCVATLQLMRGDYAHGWGNYEAWKGSRELRDISNKLTAPRWSGESLEGKTLLVWGGRGHGDVLQCVRFVPAIADRVKNQGGRLVYSCSSSLLPLLERSLGNTIDLIVRDDQRPMPAFDYQLPLCSLPLVLGIRIESLSRQRAYLRADPGKAEAWRRRFSDSPALKVGLVWTGARDHQRNRMRSVKPVDYAQAFRSLEGVDFYSLQVDLSGEANEARAAGLHLMDATDEFKSFDDTAAFIEGLDLVITVCTSVAHLAGGLGVPTWVLLDVNPHWVWMTGRIDSPWYGSVKLFRQGTYGDWAEVLVSVRHDLLALLAERGISTRTTAPVEIKTLTTFDGGRH